MRGNHRANTKPERALRSCLHNRGLRFRKDFYVPLSQGRVWIDVAFTRARLAVFVDGCFWHRCPDHGTVPRTNREYWRSKLVRNVERDLETSAALAAAGWMVLRFWEHEPVDQVAAEVETALRLAEGVALGNSRGRASGCRGSTLQDLAS
jgi:DNA mismatch endonuclease (patch repair protein)